MCLLSPKFQEMTKKHFLKNKFTVARVVCPTYGGAGVTRMADRERPLWKKEWPTDPDLK